MGFDTEACWLVSGGYYTTDDIKEVYEKDMLTNREQLKEFFGEKPFPTKYMYFVTRLDLFKPALETPMGDDGTKENVPNVEEPKGDATDGVISVYVAICGNGSVMVPMSVFPPTESWHWERKKPVKLRHAHSVHRDKKNDPNTALQFFSVVRKGTV